MHSSVVNQAGAGLRSAHYREFLAKPPEHIRWLEVISENFMQNHGLALERLLHFRENFPLALHGVSLGVMSAAPLDQTYLKKLLALIRRTEPFLVSDHLCWTRQSAHYLHDLLPFQYTRENLQHACERIDHVQATLDRTMIFENLSVYVHSQKDEMTEFEFMRQLCRRTGCGILLDVNNIYVTAVNRGEDPRAVLRAVPLEFVRQIHLAGFSDEGEVLIDTHSTAVHENVWSLFREVMASLGPVPFMIEWDANIPTLMRLDEEVSKAVAFVRAIKKRADARLSASEPVFSDPVVSKYEVRVESAGTLSNKALSKLQKKWFDATLSDSDVTGLDQDFRGSKNLKLHESFSIYQNGYTISLRDALLESFEALFACLGPEQSSLWIKDYRIVTHSISFDLGDYGERFLDFLINYSPARARPELIELARFEWTWRESFCSSAEQGMSVAEVQARMKTVEDLEQTLHGLVPSCRLALFDYPVLDLWRLRENPEALQQALVSFEARPSAYAFWAYWEREKDPLSIFIKISPMPENWFNALSTLSQGSLSFREVSENYFDSIEDVQLFFGWLTASRLIRAV